MRRLLARRRLKRRSLPLIAAFVATALVLLGRPGTAAAQTVYVYGPPPPPPPPPPPRYYYYEYREPVYALVVAGDFEGAIPVNVPQVVANTLSGGAGFKVRVGAQIRLRGDLRFTPEAGYGYDRLFTSGVLGEQIAWDMNRFFGGARLGFGRYIVPTLYGHLGYAWQVIATPIAQGNGGFSYDLGAALDFRFIPHVGFGAHFEYAAADVQPDQVSWVALGVHGDLLF